VAEGAAIEEGSRDMVKGTGLCLLLLLLETAGLYEVAVDTGNAIKLDLGAKMAFVNSLRSLYEKSI
jgi:hypothetical protein